MAEPLARRLLGLPAVGAEDSPRRGATIVAPGFNPGETNHKPPGPRQGSCKAGRPCRFAEACPLSNKPFSVPAPALPR